MRIKFVVVLLVTCCLFGFNPGSTVASEGLPVFRDIKGSFAEKSIVRLAEQGIIHGINANQFAPQKNITRLQFAVLLAKALGVQPFFPAEPVFSDVPPGTVESGYVEALANLGLINGTGPNTFDGDRMIRRQDVAVILHKALAENEQVFPGKKYADSGQIMPYALDSVAYVSHKGWMNGSRGYFYPLRNLTRAEAAVIIDRLLETRKDQGLKALQQPPELLELKANETRDIGVAVSSAPVAFTPVYGLADSDLFTVTPTGTLLSGVMSGTGILTVNAGSCSYPVTVKINNSPFVRGHSSDDGLSVSREQESVSAVTYKYNVVEHLPDGGFKNIEQKTYPGPVEGLFSNSDNWTGFLRQQGRDIIVDLGILGTVSGISMEFKQDANAGIYLPEYINGAVSVDGVSWYQLGRAYHGIAPSDKKVQEAVLSLVFPSVTARYIKLSFPVDIWVFARHLKVQGGAPAEKPVVLSPVTVASRTTGKYLQDPDIKNILLVYTGKQDYAQTLIGEHFLPLVAYIDRQGKIKGRMFDTMLFLPYSGYPCTREHWQAYLEDLFAPGRQLHALDDTVEKVNQITGKPQKEKVILTIPYPDPNQSNFDGISFSETNTGKEQAAKNRFEAVLWFYSKMMDKWSDARFKNLELVGVYWYKELVDKSVYREVELVQNVARMVSEKGQKFFWIPYYGAQGYESWKSYGFTHVFLQPNYYATQAPSEDRMERAAALAQKYGTGIEIELDSRIFSDPYYYTLFYKELNKAHQIGLDRHTPKAYYVGQVWTLLAAASSIYPEQRQVYDDLYKWINGNYN
ncbi:DUF4855 domain-containing protein [Thermincola potens]|uniref:S-layer domain protein n=1 Tax=Thermincola potens (strain JR) TaxID=635013 RepID=D5X930_THEPJ|nr:DUF4855 domain-containing protein [Thermincola potens]ADG81030.1 S-layer domain protein [Thermincola potens JR]